MEFLSEEWLAELASKGAELPETAGATLVIQHEIAGAPSGKVRYFTVWDEGRVAEVSLGKHAEPDVQVVAKAAEALKVLHGEMSPDVGFMQGRLKVDGNYRQLMVDQRDFRESEPYRALWDHMAAVTS